MGNRLDPRDSRDSRDDDDYERDAAMITADLGRARKLLER